MSAHSPAAPAAEPPPQGHAIPRRAMGCLGGAVGALLLAATNLWPAALTQGPGVAVGDLALVLTGLGLIARQPTRRTGPVCLGLMMGKGLVWTLATIRGGIPSPVAVVFTVAIFAYMGGVLATSRVWGLAGVALAAGILTTHGPAGWALVARVTFFVGLAGWIGAGARERPGEGGDSDGDDGHGEAHGSVPVRVGQALWRVLWGGK